MHKGRSIFAIFSLLVFLFPIVEIEVHAFSHRNDFHCTDHSTAHMHKGEHHCHLCDFTNDFSTTTSTGDYTPLTHEWLVQDFFFTPQDYRLQEKVFLALRGPPSIL